MTETHGRRLGSVLFTGASGCIGRQLVAKRAAYRDSPPERAEDGPERVDFPRFRPVPANDRLERDSGCPPQRSNDEVFSFYWESRRHGA